MNGFAAAADSKGTGVSYRAGLRASKLEAFREPPGTSIPPQPALERPEGDATRLAERGETPGTLAPREAAPLEREPMDWAAIASVLAERISLPIALLDRFGRIRFVNSAMEEVLGWTRHQVEGTPWTLVCPMAETEAARWLEQALRGALRTLSASAVTRSGDRVVFELELSLVGRAEEQGILLTARRTLRTPRAPSSTPQEIDYEIALGPSFGKLQRLKIGGENVALRSEEAPCFALLYERTRPCTDCPALAGEGDARPQSMVRRRAEQAGQGPVQFEVTVAERIDTSTMRLRVNTISEGTLEAIHKVKLDEVAAKAGLSDRERDVLRYLLMGRSIPDIATVLEITPRTVKYHQANVLRKVGADSRADLVRLLL